MFDIFKKKGINKKKIVKAPLPLPPIIPIFKIFRSERMVSPDGSVFNDRVVDVSGPDPNLVNAYFKEQWVDKK